MLPHVSRRSRLPGSGCPARGRAPLAAAVLLAGCVAAMPATADPTVVTYVDGKGDAGARRTDPGGDGPIDPDQHRLIDLIEMTIGFWRPTAPQADVFTGTFHSSGEFFRLDIVLDGLVNPPGNTDPQSFHPFQYGNHPIYGFVEIDMDEEAGTGGELEAPEFRYFGNAARFGGWVNLPQVPDRMAADASAFDGDFTTPPFVERSGEEFHLALLGHLFGPGDIEEIVGDGDLVFEAGEVWNIQAPWFHRAHGYEPFSLAVGGALPGEYAPRCPLRFAHNPEDDVTTVSLVFPRKNRGAALMMGQPPEPSNGNPSDQFSVREALLDLHHSALFLTMFPTGWPEEELIIDWWKWDPDGPEDHLNPTEWRLYALLGTSYTAPDPDGALFVWTDVWPKPVRGDVNGDGTADEADRLLISQFTAAHDAEDGVVDGRVIIPGFGPDFRVFDVNHNGAVDTLDEWLVSTPHDLDGNGTVDLADVAVMQACLSGAFVPYGPLFCGLADADLDGDVDVHDAVRLIEAMTGPGGG